MKALATAATLVVTLFALPAVAPARTEEVRALAPVERVAVTLREAGGVAIDEHGTLYVADGKTGAVLRLLPDGNQSIVVSGLDRPFGLAIDGEGRLLVADERGRVVRRETDGRVTLVTTSVRKPRWVAIGDDDTIFVSADRLESRRTDTEARGDERDGRVIVWSRDGETFDELLGGLRDVPALAVGGQSLYTVTEGIRLDHERPAATLLEITLDASGDTLHAELALRTPLRNPMGLALDHAGALFIAADDPAAHPHTAPGVIVKRRTDGRLVTFATGLTEPRALAFGPSGDLVLTARDASAPLLRFLAPPAPLAAAPAATREPTLPVSGRVEPGSVVDARVTDDPATVVRSDADATTGDFRLAVPLPRNAATTVLVAATAARGDGLSGVPAVLHARHDDRPPAVTITAPAEHALVRGGVRVAATATDDGSGVASVAVALDARVVGDVPGDGGAAVEAERTIETASVADGAHTVSVTAVDAAGNSALATRTIVVDNTAPETRIVDGPAGQVTATAVTFVIAGSDNLSTPDALTFAWRLDGARWSLPSPATTVALTALADGTHVFEAKAVDAAGNEDATPAQRAFTVTTAPPPSPVTVALAQIDAIRKAVAALVRSGGCSYGTSCLGTGVDGYVGIDRLVSGGWLSAAETLDPWGGRYGVVGGPTGYAVKVHGLPGGNEGGALCAQLAAGLAGQTIVTRVWGGWDQKIFEAGFPNP